MFYIPFNATNDLISLLVTIKGELQARENTQETKARRVSFSGAIECVQSVLAARKAIEGLDARDQAITGLIQAICPLGANGLGDAVIWPALRMAGLHRYAEELTRITNDLRKQSLEIERLNSANEHMLSEKVGLLKEIIFRVHADAGEGEIEQALIHALDEIVRDASDASAANANNGGLDAQLRHLMMLGWHSTEIVNAVSLNI